MGRQQKISPASQTGFTLIELLVVLVIMSMAYALASPMISAGVSGTELKASARQLAAGLRKTRSEAIARRREEIMTLDVEERNFRLGGEGLVYRLPKSVMIQVFTAKSELVTGNVGSIRFFPDGGSTGGRISVSSHERKYDVDVNWLTGQVTILN